METLVVLVVLGVAGYLGYRYYVRKKGASPLPPQAPEEGVDKGL